MPTLTHIVSVNRPPHVAMETFFDWSQDTSWRPAVTRMTVHPSGPATVGQRILEELKVAGLSFVTPTRIDSVHPYRVTWSGGSSTMTIRGWREIEPAGSDGCRLKELIDVELRGSLRLLTPVLTPMYRRVMRTELDQLVQELESVPVP